MSVQSAAAWIAVGGTLSGATVAYLGTLTAETIRSRRQRRELLEAAVSGLISSCHAYIDAIKFLHNLRANQVSQLFKEVEGNMRLAVGSFRLLDEVATSKIWTTPEEPEPAHIKYLTENIRDFFSFTFKEPAKKPLWQRTINIENALLALVFAGAGALTLAILYKSEKGAAEEVEREKYQTIQPYLKAIHEAEAKVFVGGNYYIKKRAAELVEVVDSMIEFTNSNSSSKDLNSKIAEARELEKRLLLTLR